MVNTKEQINILMTTTTFPRWKNDSELRIILDTAKNLQKFYPNLNIIILAPHYPGSQKKETMEKINIIRYTYFFTAFQKLCYGGGIQANLVKNRLLHLLVPFLLFAQILAIKKIVNENKINIIHAHWLIPQGLSAVIYKKIFNKNIKIVLTVRGTDIFGLNIYLLNLLKTFVLKNCDCITAISTALKKAVLELTHKKEISVIKNGVNIDKKNISIPKESILKKYNAKSFLLLFVGRLIKKKGVNYLISAMSHIKTSFPDIKLLIVGDGPEKYNLKNQVDSLALSNNVEFTGFLPNQEIYSLQRAADIFIMPSISEGLSNAILEAMICGTPVIATKTGGITDIIIDNKTGLLVQTHNSDDISRKTIYLLRNQELKYTLTFNAEKYVRNNFTWEIIASEYEKIYQQCLFNNIK